MVNAYFRADEISGETVEDVSHSLFNSRVYIKDISRLSAVSGIVEPEICRIVALKLLNGYDVYASADIRVPKKIYIKECH